MLTVSRRAFLTLTCLTCVSFTSQASAQWLAGGRLFAVPTAWGVVVVDAKSGRVERALPRRMHIAQAPESFEGEAIVEPVTDRDRTLLSRNGGRLTQLGDEVLVWNVFEGTAELHLPNSRALAFLGPQQDSIAVLTQQEFGATEFAVWHLPSRRKAMSRVFPRAKYQPLPQQSERYAAFVSGRVVWIWNQAHQSFVEHALPQGFLALRVHDSPGGALAMVVGKGVAPDTERAIVLDTTTWRIQSHIVFPPASLTSSQVVGLRERSALGVLRTTAGRTKLIQFDVSNGVITQETDVSPDLRVTFSRRGWWRSRPRGLQHSRPRGPERFFLSSSGNRLFGIESEISSWNVGVSPPERLDSLCEDDECEQELNYMSEVNYSPDDAALMIGNRGLARSFTWVDLGSGDVESFKLDPGAVDRAARALRMPMPAVAICGIDRVRCLEYASLLREQALRACKAGVCEMDRSTIFWQKAACGELDPSACDALAKIAASTKEAGLAVSAAMGHCQHGTGLGERASSDCLTPFDISSLPGASSELRTNCSENVRYCWLAALVAEKGRAFDLAFELARRGCFGHDRRACMSAGDLAVRLDRLAPAKSAFEHACLLLEETDCRRALSKVSAKR